MPNFPRYNSKNQLTSERPGPLMEKDRTGEVVAQAGNQLGKAIGDFGVKWQQGKNTIQKTQTEAKFKTTMLDIQNRASIDPDEKNSYKYMNEIEKLKQTSLSEIDDPQARAEMDIDLNYQSRVGQIQVENLYRKKMIDSGQTSSLQLIDYEVRNPTDSSFINIQNNLNAQVSSGVFDEKTAYQLLQKANDDLGTNRVNNDIFNAQTQEGVNSIKDGLKSGGYETGGVVIDPKEKMKLLRSIETRGRQITTNDNFVKKVSRQKDTHELIDLSNNGLLTPSKLEEYFKTERISNSTYTALQEKIDSPVGPTANTDPQTYYDITNALLKDDLEPEKAIERILKANASGKLSSDDAKKIYEMHLIPSGEDFKNLAQSQGGSEFEKMKQSFDAENQSVKDKKGWLKSAFKSLNNYFSGPDKEKDVAGAMQKLLGLVKENKLPDKNIPEGTDWVVAQENLKKYPHWANLPEKGKRGKDRFKNKVIVYPDGRVVLAE